MDGFAKILHRASSKRCNQLCQILFQSDQGFRFCDGLNFWLSHRKECLPLAQGLNSIQPVKQQIRGLHYFCALCL